MLQISLSPIYSLLRRPDTRVHPVCSPPLYLAPPIPLSHTSGYTPRWKNVGLFRLQAFCINPDWLDFLPLFHLSLYQLIRDCFTRFQSPEYNKRSKGGKEKILLTFSLSSHMLTISLNFNILFCWPPWNFHTSTSSTLCNLAPSHPATPHSSSW